MDYIWIILNPPAVTVLPKPSWKILFGSRETSVTEKELPVHNFPTGNVTHTDQYTILMKTHKSESFKDWVPFPWLLLLTFRVILFPQAPSHLSPA